MAWGLASIRVSLATNDLSDVAFVLAWRGPPRRPKVRCPRVGATHARQLRSRPPKRFTRADPRRCPLSQPGAAFCCASLRCAPGPSSQCASAAASERRCATLLSVIAVASLCSYSPWSPRLPLLAALQAARPATLLWAILATARTMVVRAQQRRYGERRTTRRPSTAAPPTADSLRVAATWPPTAGALVTRNGICSSKIEFTAL
jgi:hypothetical protein